MYGLWAGGGGGGGGDLYQYGGCSICDGGGGDL